MRIESAMWMKLRPHLVTARLDPVRVDNPIHPGTPDVNLVTGVWIELKAMPAWPARESTILRIPHYTPQQRVWLFRRWRAGGRAYLLLQIVASDEWIFFDGDVAAKVVGRVDRKGHFKNGTIWRSAQLAEPRWFHRAARGTCVHAGGRERDRAVTHDADAALDFLIWAYPMGPWCLTAIEVDRLGITTATFYPDNSDRLRGFLTEHAHRNMYWMVNRPLHDLVKKAEKTDVAAAHFLHVDIDPRTNLALKTPEELSAHLKKERERIYGLLALPPQPIPRPTCVIFSGGGYQGLWRLSEPFTVDGDVSRAEEIESYTRQLEYAFGADSCHNVDRILRLPGSLNYPNAKKRAKGRTVERAEVV